jgi:hypothetical protein
MTRNAERFNLGKRGVLVTTSLLCILSLVFPYAVHNGKVLIWVSCGGILILRMLILAIKNKNMGTTTVETVTPLEETTPFDKTTPLKEVIVLEVNSPMDEVASEGEASSIEVDYSLEEIIEQGFQAKEEANYLYAVELFISALDKKPSPDIAFYLITDSYWLLKQSTLSNEALNRVEPYINEYMESAPPEWLVRLSEWLQKEINNNF